MHKLFVTQVYQAKIKLNLAEIEKEAYQIQKADHDGQKWSKDNYINGYTSYGSWDQLHLLSSTFLDLKLELDKHVYKFCKMLDHNVNKNSLKLCTLWVNIMPTGAMHTSHIHPQSVISGTFYVATPPQASSIKFEDPRLSCFMNTPITKLNCKKHNLRFFSLQPKAGDVVLFESWLKHEVTQNLSKKPRISVSFNYDWA